MAKTKAKTKLIEYFWWGFNKETEPPAHLKTKKQLAELGLKPLEPVGVIRTPKYNCYLYNPRSKKLAAPKGKASEAQLRALAKGRAVQRKKRFKSRYWGYCGQGWHLTK